MRETPTKNKIQPVIKIVSYLKILYHISNYEIFLAYDLGSLMGQNPISQSQMMPISHTQMVPSHTIQPMGYGNQGQIQQIGVNPSYQPQQNNCVLLVSNLDPERIKCYHLFILFGVYGNVVRVKILYNKKDNALLQMSDNQQAQTGK